MQLINTARELEELGGEGKSTLLAFADTMVVGPVCPLMKKSNLDTHTCVL